MLASLVSSALFASLTVAIHLNLPKEIKQCDKVPIDAGGKGKINVAVLHAEDECGDAIKEWLNVPSATFNWTAKVDVGTKLVFLAEENDSDAEEWSQPITVVAGSTDCLDNATGSAPSTPTQSTADAPPPSTLSVPPSTGNTNGFAPPSQPSTNVQPPSNPTSNTNNGGSGGAKNVAGGPGSPGENPSDNASALRAGAVGAVVAAFVAALF